MHSLDGVLGECEARIEVLMTAPLGAAGNLLERSLAPNSQPLQ
jgi:hypothetical protein